MRNGRGEADLGAQRRDHEGSRVELEPVKRHRGEPGHGKKTPGGAGTHKPNPLKTNPPTDSRARPHPNPGTHASPQTAPHTPSCIKRSGGDGDADGDGAQTREREPVPGKFIYR
jgi:hypothetical protein